MEEQGRRPGGLTALAVLNVVFGGLGALTILGLVAILGAADQETKDEIAKEIPNQGLLWITILLGVVNVALMITAGVGYLGMKRWGRTLGNVYGILALIGTSLGVVVAGFDIGTVIGLVYPILTLALINTTFKDDLVH
jgi:hypothetical protein